MLLTGLLVFTGAGVACATRTSLTLLVGGRLVQGLGASVGPTLARAVVRDRFEGFQSAAVLSRITKVMIVAPLLAPTIGGYVLGTFGWRRPSRRSPSPAPVAPSPPRPSYDAPPPSQPRSRRAVS